MLQSVAALIMTGMLQFFQAASLQKYLPPNGYPKFGFCDDRFQFEFSICKLKQLIYSDIPKMQRVEYNKIQLSLLGWYQQKKN